MPSYLIVANQTLSSPTLMAAVQERVEADEPTSTSSSRPRRSPMR